MLKLTGKDGTSVYISPAHISAMSQFSSGNTDIRFAGGSYLVKESPEEIMAMEPMLYFLNPMMVIEDQGMVRIDRGLAMDLAVANMDKIVYRPHTDSYHPMPPPKGDL